MRLVIFDVDGTLVDSQAQILGAMRVAFSALGREMPDRKTALSIVGLSLAEAFERLMPDASGLEISKAVEAYRNTFADARVRGAKPELYEGIADVVTNLAAEDDTLLAVATGKSRRGLNALIESHGWQGTFISTQVADDHPSKPNPSMILRALSETGIDPYRAVMIGDTTFDLEMAQAAGVKSIGVTWGYHDAQALGIATTCVDTPAALIPAINKVLES